MTALREAAFWRFCCIPLLLPNTDRDPRLVPSPVPVSIMLFPFADTVVSLSKLDFPKVRELFLVMDRELLLSWSPIKKYNVKISVMGRTKKSPVEMSNEYKRGCLTAHWPVCGSGSFV